MVGLHLLKMVWSRLEGAWRGWRAKLVTWRRNRLQRRFVEEGEEIDFCSICHAEYAAGEEVFIILVNQVKPSTPVPVDVSWLPPKSRWPCRLPQPLV